MKRIKWVYVAGPYTGGDTIINVRNAIEAAIELREAGFVPIIPHLFHFVHFLFPRPYQLWMDWDSALLERCDALVRLSGDSPGSETEIEQMKRQGGVCAIASGPSGISSFIEWANDHNERCCDGE